MDNELILMIAKSGVFALLFVFLLVYVLKDSDKREKKYQQIIEKLSNQLDIVVETNNNVKQIKNVVLAKPLYVVKDSV